MERVRKYLSVAVAACLLVVMTGTAYVRAAAQTVGDTASTVSTATPIKHIVVIYQENVSFDHYFGTYPNALNLAGESTFKAAPNTPSVNGLNDMLLNHNPNLANPKRLAPGQAVTCDQDHAYSDEQKAFDHGLMDKFVQSVAGGSCPDKSIVMDYYDGNTVTALWNYAQHFALNDNSFGTTFGPSTPGALNLVSGNTQGAEPTNVKGSVSNGVDIGDPDPTFDDCSSTKYTTVSMSGKNIGDLLNAKNITWGWFQGGFKPTSVVNGKAVCGATTKNVGGASDTDYSPHHEPFQYFASTTNPHHLPPTSVSMIGRTDQANHQYDLSDFWAAADANNLPAVSFLKAPEAEDGHAGYSDPLDEQTFLVNTINRLQTKSYWKDTAVIIAYDDSDGWYDHVMGPIINQSNDASYDALTDAGACGATVPGNYPDRCGYGPRLPLLVISGYAKQNFVDHTTTDQSSVLRFIEDNWNTGRIGNQSADAMAGSILNMFDFTQAPTRTLYMNPTNGQPMS